MIVEFFDLEKAPEVFDVLFSQEGDNLPIPNIGHKVTLRNGIRVFGGEVEYVSWSFDTTGRIYVKIGFKILFSLSEQDIDESERLK